MQEFPTLLCATCDWGGGDFETALERAALVGNKDIAPINWLAKGPRSNLFVLIMIGKTQIVKSYLEAFPGYQEAREPQGFTLIMHKKR